MEIDDPEKSPMTQGPRRTPARISPITPGCFIFSNMKLKTLAKIIANVISSSIEQASH
jgi:hypothetical protein